MDTMYLKLLLTDHRFISKQLKILNNEYTANHSNELSNIILRTKAELNAIDDEMNTIIEQGFFPNHNIPILQLLTNQKNNQNPPSTNSSSS